MKRKRGRRNLSLMSGLEPTQMLDFESNMNYATDNYESYVNAKFVDLRLQSGLSTVTRTVDVNAKIAELKEYLDQKFIILQPNHRTLFGMNAARTLMFTLEDKQWAVSVSFTGAEHKVDAAVFSLEESFEQNPCYIRWVYDSQYMEYVKMPVNTHHLPFQEMYPYMKEDLHDYYDRFVNSSANILLLIGNPGTGKTSWIRGLLHHAKQSATLTYHEKILEQDRFFVDWLESDDMFLILEDADTLLLPRKEGNNLMARFLNMGDGLMGFTNKKMIFSTNLPNISSIDSALTRPGRCFDILHFRNLTHDEAKVMCAKIGTEPPNVSNNQSVSELFASKRNEEVSKNSTKSFGFI